MRIPTPRWLRLAGLSRGAIAEKGDGELTLVPIIYPAAFISSPIYRVYGQGQAPYGGGQIEDSFVKWEAADSIGIVGATQTQIAVLTKGHWRIDYLLTVFYQGSANPGDSGLALVDFTSGFTAFLGRIRMTNTAAPGIQYCFSGSIDISVGLDGFHFDLVRAATTVASDTLVLSAFLNAKKLL